MTTHLRTSPRETVELDLRAAWRDLDGHVLVLLREPVARVDVLEPVGQCVTYVMRKA